MSDTPLTDALEVHGYGVWQEDYYVPSSFARELERRVAKLEAQALENMAGRCGFISGNKVMGWDANGSPVSE